MISGEDLILIIMIISLLLEIAVIYLYNIHKASKYNMLYIKIMEIKPQYELKHEHHHKHPLHNEWKANSNMTCLIQSEDNENILDFS